MTETNILPKATSFTVSSATVDDFMPKNRMLEIGGDRRPFTTATRQSREGVVFEPDLFTIASDGTLHHFRADDSDAGWQENSFALPELAGATDIRLRASSAYPTDGQERMVLVVAVAFGSRAAGLVILEHTPRGGWTKLTLPNIRQMPIDQLAFMIANCRDAGFANLAGGKAMSFYSCLPQNLLIGFAIDQQGKVKLIEPPRLPRGAAQDIDVLAGLENEQAAVIRRTHEGLAIFRGAMDTRQRDTFPITFTPEPLSVRLPIGPSPDVTSVRPITDSRQIVRGVLVGDAEGAMAFVPLDAAGRPGEPVLLPEGPKGVQSLAGTAEQGGGASFYATDRAGLIWRGEVRNGGARWEPTGIRGQRLASPQTVGGQPCLFVEGLEGGIDQLALTTEGEWIRRTVDVGQKDAEADAAPVHALQISTVTAQSDPVGETALQLFADQPVVVEYEGRLVRLRPDRPLQIVSNATGAVRVKMHAKGLDAPVVTVRYPNGGAEARFRPQDAALWKLANRDPNFPVDAAALKAAGLLPAETPADSADSVVTVIKAAAEHAFEEGSAAPMQFQKRRLMASAGDSVPSAVGVMVTRTRKGVEIAPTTPDMARFAAAEALDGAGTGWNDFWNWLRQGWDQATSFVVEVVNKSVRIAAEIAGQLRDFVAKTARRIGEGLQGLFAFLGQLGSDLVDAAARAIRWLAEKLGWDDVIRAKNAVKAHSLQCLRDLQKCISQSLPDAVSRGIARVRGEVNEAFNKAIRFTEGEPGKQGEAVTKSPIRSNLQQHGATALSVQHAVPDKASEGMTFTPSAELNASLLKLGAQAQDFGKGDELKATLVSIEKMVHGKVSVSDGLTLALGQLLEMLRKLVLLALDAADMVQRLVLELVGHAIKLLTDMLETPITKLGKAFYWVNNLYKGLSGGSDLSIIDLSCLLFVTPGVILHHLILRKSVTSPEIATEPVETFLAQGPALLNAEAANGPLPTPTTDAAARFFASARIIYSLAAAVWTFLRSIVCRFEDEQRAAAIITGGASDVATKVIGLLIAVADWTLRLWLWADLFFNSYVAGWVESSVRWGASGIAQLMALFAVMVVLGMLGVVLYGVLQIEATVRIFLNALISLLTAIGMAGWNLYRWIAGPAKDVTTDEGKAAFHLDRVASLLDQIRGSVQFGVPIGASILKSGESISGTAIMGTNMILNVLGYALSGLVMGAAVLARSRAA